MILFTLIYKCKQLTQLALLLCRAFDVYVFVIAENRFSRHHPLFVPFKNSFVHNIFFLNYYWTFCLLERDETRSFELPVEAQLLGLLLHSLLAKIACTFLSSSIVQWTENFCSNYEFSTQSFTLHAIWPIKLHKLQRQVW